MARERKGGLAALLPNSTEEKEGEKENTQPFESDDSSVSNDTSQKQKVKTAVEQKVISKDPMTEEQLTIRVPKRYLDIIDRYRMHRIIRTGDYRYSKKDAFVDILRIFEETFPDELLKVENKSVIQ